MKKLLFVMMHLEMGGAERSLVNLLNEIDYNEYSVDLLLIKKKGELISQLPQNVNIIETPYELRSLFSNRIEKIRGIKYFVIRGCSILYSEIYGKIKPGDNCAVRWNGFYDKAIPKLDRKYDVAISYLAGPSMFYVANKVEAKKKIVFIHSDYKASGAFIGKNTDFPYFKKFDVIPTISEQCKNSLVKEFPDIREKFVVVPNITSTRLIEARSCQFIPEEYKERKSIICSVGRLSNEKGFDMAAQAAAILKSRKILFSWYIVGEGGERKKIQEIIAKNHLEDCFFLLGIRDNPYPYMRYADIVVQPSRYEGKSMVLDEAKILAKPIIATNYTTVHDQLTEKEGMIVEMSPKGIADGVQKILSDESVQSQFSDYLKQKDYGNTNEMTRFYEILR